MKSFKIPTQEQIDAAAQRCRTPEHAAYFFARLENPQWIKPLERLGLFKDAPPVQQIDGGRLRYIPWPASKYLARMAKHSPAEVAAIFAKINTDNPSVVGDLLDAALEMPADSAAILVPAVREAAKARYLWVAFKDASELCAKLATQGEPDAALALAQSLFEPASNRGANKDSGRDEYWYKDGLKKILPALVAVRAEKLCRGLCAWLRAAVEDKGTVDPESGADYSYSWRPAVEEHEQNRDYDFAGAMVGFVRHALEEAVSSDNITLDVALSILGARPYLIFKRVRLHLINTFADKDPDLARTTMMGRAFFNNYEFKHEYAMLIGKHFGLLGSV
jgi:hypothetical protein